ncbi:MAG: hypothetical protein ACP5NW_01130, partial [Candidatus Woesearchaeota archaeon]
MAVDVLTVVLTAVFTGIGISIGNALYDVYFKDPLKKLKKENDRIKKTHAARIRKLHLLVAYKRPWLAALLNFFIWGIGYFYIGKRRWLGSFLFLVQLFIIGGYAATIGHISGAFEGASFGFLTLMVSIALAVDAY